MFALICRSVGLLGTRLEAYKLAHGESKTIVVSSILLRFSQPSDDGGESARHQMVVR